jgi:anti-sigma factor RsiW
MTCREFTEFLDRYLAKELPAAEQARFDRHLGVCRDCQNYLATYQQTVEAGRAALRSDEALPDDIPDGLVAAVMANIGK